MTDKEQSSKIPLDALSAEIGATFLSSLKGGTGVDEYEGSLAMTLLRSSDQKVVDAAKRIFFNTMGADEKPEEDRTSQMPTDASVTSSITSSMQDASASTQRAPTVAVGSSLDGQNNKQIPKPTPTGFSSHVGKRARPAVVKGSVDGKKKSNETEKVQRRERNRMHARKTRQRKKEHMKCLRDRADELKQEHLSLKQRINDKQTANILLIMGSSNGAGPVSVEAEVEALLKRPNEEIPDASNIQELPTLYLPGHHSKARQKKGHEDPADLAESEPDALQEVGDDINYELLSKDRSKCNADELDKIRRERNRMHAKRTRDRKRLFMEEMETLISNLENENAILHRYWCSLNGNLNSASFQAIQTSNDPAPNVGSNPQIIMSGNLQSLLDAVDRKEQEQEQQHHHRVMSSMSAVSPSPAVSRRESISEDDPVEGGRPPKRAKTLDESFKRDQSFSPPNQIHQQQQKQQQQPLTA